MGNVISIHNRKEIEVFNGKVITQPTTGVEYLFICKDNLIVEDYEEVLLSIMDEEYFVKAEDQIKAIVNGYFAFDK
jgi:hypothetical protein